MDTFLTLEEIQHKCEQLNDIYQINEETFYRVIENWADRTVSTEKKLLASFQELLQVVSDEITSMEDAVQLKPTCQMGCAFCCYFPIIISEMEAKLMKNAIEAFPAEKKHAIEKHLSHYFDNYRDKIQENTQLDFETDKDFKRKYMRNQLPCPLLDTETNQCMAYEIRPIPCRTYVNYANPSVCADNLMPKETISFEFLYNEYMGALNEFLQYLYEQEDTAFIQYPDDAYSYDYLANWLKR